MLAALFNLLLVHCNFFGDFFAPSEDDPCLLLQIIWLVFIINETIEVSMCYIEVILKVVCLLFQFH